MASPPIPIGRVQVSFAWLFYSSGSTGKPGASLISNNFLAFLGRRLKPAPALRFSFRSGRPARVRRSARSVRAGRPWPGDPPRPDRRNAAARCAPRDPRADAAASGSRFSLARIGLGWRRRGARAACVTNRTSQPSGRRRIAGGLEDRIPAGDFAFHVALEERGRTLGTRRDRTAQIGNL